MLMHIFEGGGMWIFSLLPGGSAPSTDSRFFLTNSSVTHFHILHSDILSTFSTLSTARKMGTAFLPPLKFFYSLSKGSVLY